jgi:hypothetical protein
MKTAGINPAARYRKPENALGPSRPMQLPSFARNETLGDGESLAPQ